MQQCTASDVLQRVKVMKILDTWLPKRGSLHFSSAATSTCLHADGLAKVIRGSTNQNPGISDTSKMPNLQIASHAHSESIQNHK
jgi:hypothetical protein